MQPPSTGPPDRLGSVRTPLVGSRCPVCQEKTEVQGRPGIPRSTLPWRRSPSSRRSRSDD